MDRKKHTDSWLEQMGTYYEEPDDFQEMEDDFYEEMVDEDDNELY